VEGFVRDADDVVVVLGVIAKCLAHSGVSSEPIKRLSSMTILGLISNCLWNMRNDVGHPHCTPYTPYWHGAREKFMHSPFV
jgi:hypothetical protein